MSAEQQTTEDSQSDQSSAEGPPVLTHAMMRGMFYRNEITREVLYQLERQWANALGHPLPESALQRAEEIAATEGQRFWLWREEQSLPATKLLELAKKRAEDLKAHAQSQTSIQSSAKSNQ